MPSKLERPKSPDADDCNKNNFSLTFNSCKRAHCLGKQSKVWQTSGHATTPNKTAQIELNADNLDVYIYIIVLFIYKLYYKYRVISISL